MGGLIEILLAGGPVIWLLAVLSLASLTLIAAKAIQLAPVTGGGAARDAALERWAKGDREGARAALASGKAPADRIGAAAMAGLQAGTPRSVLDAELTRRGNAELEAMTRHIRLLELVAMISPLLGLLGTVLGMIQSFQQLEMAAGSANASVLAGGIWQALLTTAAGLIVAIPAAIAATLLAGRAERAAQRMEDVAARVMALEDGGGAV